MGSQDPLSTPTHET